MRDKYDEAIEYLTAHPEHLLSAWCMPGDDTPPKIAQAHCLFLVAGPTDSLDEPTPHGADCGCLTQIRCFDGVEAWTPELTAAIKSDTRLPMTERDLSLEHLPAFAEWQRRIDKELNRQ